MGMAIDPPPKPATSRPIPAPGEPIYAGEPARDNEAPPTMAEYKALVESIRASLDEHYAQRGKHWAYVSLGVGVGIVLGMLLGDLIF